MDALKESTVEWINRDIKTALAELDELVGIKYDYIDPKKIAKNNEAFIQLLDRLQSSFTTPKNSTTHLKYLFQTKSVTL